MSNLKQINVLTVFKCFLCKQIPDDNQVAKCVKDHMVCLKCVKSGDNCPCGVEKLTTNPLVNVISKSGLNSSKEHCPYNEQGCGWIFSAENNEFEGHILECKYRPYKCIGTTLNIWKCPWIGMQQDIANHIKNDHKGSFLNYYHSAAINYNPTKSIRFMNLIDAFNKKFVFYYDAKATSLIITFMIFLIGRKFDAQKYLIDFELKSGIRKWKCVELCYCDSDNLDQHIEELRCFAIPKKVFESFVINGLVNYRFIIKRKEALEEEEKVQGKHALENGYGRGGLDRLAIGGSTASLAIGRSTTSLAIGRSTTSLVMGGSTTALSMSGGGKTRFDGESKKQARKSSRPKANSGKEQSEKSSAGRHPKNR